MDTPSDFPNLFQLLQYFFSIIAASILSLFTIVFFFFSTTQQKHKKKWFCFCPLLWCSSRLHNNTLIKYDDDDENTNTTHSHCSCTTGLRPPCLPIPKPKQANTVHFVHPFSISSGLFKGT